jgi:hypothetical protein
MIKNGLLRQENEELRKKVQEYDIVMAWAKKRMQEREGF